ncbi:hypothetical protein ACKTEK_14020 [Tepidamorphus sp. 3E244]|uniref:hypothetical protein n=1 Tax=Tepidamorphus sp. 3E244 TaxID=3385498 RepID=UPI0038FCD0E8
MRITAQALAACAIGLLAPAAHAAAPNGPAFVAAFEEACVPQRLSFTGIQGHAASVGWSTVKTDVHPELEEVTSTADHETAIMGEPGWTFEREQFSREIDGRTHYLIVTRVHAPELITLIGCYLYDFDATQGIDAALVTEFVGKPIAREIEDKGFTQYTWGPNFDARPRTLDTNLSFISEDSPHKATTGFSGLVLKFETSEPDPAQEPEKTE